MCFLYPLNRCKRNCCDTIVILCSSCFLTWRVILLPPRTLRGHVHSASWVRLRSASRPPMGHERKQRCRTPWIVSSPQRWQLRWWVRQKNVSHDTTAFLWEGLALFFICGLNQLKDHQMYMSVHRHGFLWCSRRTGTWSNIMLTWPNSLHFLMWSILHQVSSHQFNREITSKISLCRNTIQTHADQIV